MTLHSNTLNAALKTVTKSISLKTTGAIEGVPVSMVRLIAEDGKLTITGTDLMTSISCSFDADIEQEGGVLVPMLAVDWLKYVSNQQVTIKSSKQQVRISTPDAHTYLYALEDTSQYPLIPTPRTDGYKPIFSIKGAELLSIIAGISFVAEAGIIFGASRPEYSCVNIQPREDIEGMILDFVCCDTYHLSHYSYRCKDVDFTNRILLPVKGLALCKHVLKEDSRVIAYASIEKGANVVVFEDEYANQIGIRASAVTSFPPYMRAYPECVSTTATIETDVFKSVMQRAALFSNSNTHVTRLIVDEKQNLTVEVPENDRQEGMVSHISSVYQGIKEQYPCESRSLITEYVKELAAVLPSEVTCVHIGKGPIAAVVFEALGTNFKYAIVPYVKSS